MNRNSLAKGLVGTALGLAGAGALPQNTEAQQARLRSYLSDTTLVPGNTYEMQVRVDTTQVPNEIFSVWRWNPRLNTMFNGGEGYWPSSVNPSDNPQDFFYNIMIDEGFTTPVPGFDYINDKLVQNAGEGASNKTFDNGLLATYSFVVPQNAPVGSIGGFVLGSVIGGTTSGNEYRCSNHNLIIEDGYDCPDPNAPSCCRVPGDRFTIVPRADTNCDGIVDFFDIDPFVTALFDEPMYRANYPSDCYESADVNSDGIVDFFDIDPFVNTLFGGNP